MSRIPRIALFVTTLLFFSPIATAQTFIPASGLLPGTDCSFITGDFEFNCIPIYVGYLIQTVFALTGGFALMEILTSGYEIAMSGITGDKEKGKKRLQWALIGLALSILSFLIVDFAISMLLLGP